MPVPAGLLPDQPVGCTSGCENLVRMKGLEPPRLSALEPKSRASTNSATFAWPAQALIVAGRGGKRKACTKLNMAVPAGIGPPGRRWFSAAVRFGRAPLQRPARLLDPLRGPPRPPRRCRAAPPPQGRRHPPAIPAVPEQPPRWHRARRSAPDHCRARRPPVPQCDGNPRHHAQSIDIGHQHLPSCMRHRRGRSIGFDGERDAVRSSAQH